MQNVAILTDSCASIPESFIETLQIHWVPYYIHHGNETLRDLVTIDRETFYQWLPTVDELPKTAAPGPGDYLEKYRQLVEEQKAEEILSIHMTSKGSGAYDSAMTAREMAVEHFPNLRIEVIDTLNVAMCHGWMVIESARRAQAGDALEAIIANLQAMIPVTRMIQTADTLRYLQMGGRIGRATHLVGTLLNIKPLIGMEDGVIVPVGRARSRLGAYRKMVDYVEQSVGSNTKIKVAYLHAAALEEVEKIRALLEKRLTVVESLIAELSPALGVHTGPGTAGLCFFPVYD
jgi:DegV family protein with EDD domain